jgi:hypothetical protein
MAVAKWATPSSRSSSLVTNELDSLISGDESVVFPYDNSSNRNLYGAVTLKLGSITPAAGGYVTLRVTLSDGTDTANKAAGDIYSATLLSGASAKVVIFPMVRIYPFSLRFSVINNSGTTFNAADNDIYVTPYNEDVS